MKKLLITLSFLLSLPAYARQHAETDSTATELKEVIVTADTKIETAKKVILRPSELEKRHSTNGYVLLQNMNLPDFNVDPSAQTITTPGGGNVAILVNGVETQPEELATLSASEIVQIEYRRNPGGKYVGCGVVINFITEQYDFGGNVYLSADEGLARQYGGYVGMANYKKEAVTLTLTANATWDNISELKHAENRFTLNDGVLNQSITPIENITRTNSQDLNFKFAHADANHSFDAALALTRSARPRNEIKDEVTYTGLYNFGSTASRTSKEHALSPTMKLHYNLYLPGGHTLMANANIRHGHTDYRSSYSETDENEIINNTLENNLLASATLGYFKSFASGLSLGLTIDEYYNYYRDEYSGSFNSRQTLTNNHAMTMFHIDQNLPFGLSYYVSAGITDLYSTIGRHTDNQLSPMAFYGLTYACNQKQSIPITGSYAHSIYNPSYKNATVIRTSFFEATAGNPELGQMQAFQNKLSYNGRFGHFGLSFSYDFLKYFGNTSNRYFADDNIMYHQLVNDGNFHYHKLILGLSANFLDNKLRLGGNATYSMNRFNSEYRPTKSNDLRADFSAAYMFGDWMIKGVYAVPFSVLGIEGVTEHNPAQYGLSINWQKGNWAAGCSVDNFLARRLCTLTEADYGVYHSIQQSLSNQKGRNISLSVTYMLPYGKKTEKGRVEAETAINSAILRPF